MVDELSSVVPGSSVLIVGLQDADIVEALPRLVQSDQLVLDLVNLPNRDELRGQYQGVCW